MDISINERVEKVGFKDILAGLKDIFIGHTISKDEEKINKEINEIYKVEAEIGATDRIATLVKGIQTHITKEPKRKSSTKVQTRKTEIKENVKVIDDEERDR